MLYSRILPQMQKALKHPERAYKFAIWKMKEKFLWDYYYEAIREPKVKSCYVKFIALFEKE